MADFVPLSEFDFSVRLPTHAVTVKAGQQVSVPVMVGGIKGKPRPIMLTVTDWQSAGLNAEILHPVVLSGRVATLNVYVPLGTPPGSYRFTVRGETEETFKTSSDSVTVIVEPEDKGKDEGERGDARQEPGSQASIAQPEASASVVRTKRGVLARSYGKAPARPVPAGRRALLVAIMFVMAGVLAYYIGTQLRTGVGSSAGGIAGTYVGTSTFCISSVMGGAPECGTSKTPGIQIDSAGDVLGPVLFGKIEDGNFRGEARTGDGTTFPMTGDLSGGTLRVSYTSSSVTWTITLQKQ
ncbi:MAG: hypothetical protein QUS33_08250 [Dehalococcoidia bacterium]|nr:hypothetical protein [Dehalococcoidia bacterium]